MSTPTEHAPPERLTPGARRALVASLVGTLIEWYDYALYGAAAGLVIGPLFFPGSVSSAAELAAFATFAVGFVFRPLGGLVIAHIGDRFGRKPAMILTIALMGLATVGIGLLPTAASIGAWAAVLLVLLRILQGFGAGAELAGAMTVVAEFAPPRRRGFYTAIVLSAPPAGTLLATLAFLAVSSLPSADLLAGGWWRAPFLVSVVLFFLALWIRHRMEETPEYATVRARQSDQQREAVPFVQLMRGSWRRVLAGFFAVTGHNANNYILAAFSLGYLTQHAGMSKPDALLAVSLGSLAGVVMSPVGGLIGDRIGAGRAMGLGAGLGILYAYPLFLALHSGRLGVVVAALVFGYGVVLALTSGAQGAFLTNLFPAHYRFSGVAVARELNGAVVAGNTPLVASALIAAADGEIHLAAAFLAACFLVTLIAVGWAGRAGDNPSDTTDTRASQPTPADRAIEEIA